MSRLLRFPSSVKRDPAIEVWMREHSGQMGAIAQRWFEVMRECGDDVRELLHDDHPTACVGDAAFGYVNAVGDLARAQDPWKGIGRKGHSLVAARKRLDRLTAQGRPR